MNAKDVTIKEVRGTGVPIVGDDIDTDRIIPARFMKVVSFSGLGAHAFHDERYDTDGNKKDHPFNDVNYDGASILITGSNFGCGSSREHAPQALKDYGIRAVIGISFADIFAGNCVSLGIPAVRLERENVSKLAAVVQQKPDTPLYIDLENKTVTAGDLDLSFEIDEAARQAFVQGLWDMTSMLLSNAEKIEEKYEALPYTKGFAR